MPRPIRAWIDAGALAHNLAVAKARAGRARVWAVMKANAYGHGLLRAAHAMRGADGFAVLDLNEALRLREAYPDKPILLLEGFFEPADLQLLAVHDIAAVVHNVEQVRMLETAERETPRRGTPRRVFLKMNSGMNRLGIAPSGYRAVHDRLAHLSSLESIGLMTHFADADGGSGITSQLERFQLHAAGIAGERSLANSATVLRFPEAAADWTRPGIMLYGASPFADQGADAFGLRPAMTLMSEIIAVQQLVAGDRIGYGGTFVAAASMRVGVVACGYADGYPRHAPSGTPVLIDGARAPLVGRVSMDMITVDLTGIPHARVGSAVTLWGDGLPADEVAAAAGTISYELLCALAPRVPVRERANRDHP